MTADKYKADEVQIRQVIDRWAKAVRTKDLPAVMAFYAPDVVSFDIVPPLEYLGTKAWDKTFAAYDGPMGYEVRDLSVTVGDGVAFVHSLNRASGTLKNGQPSSFWLRWTAGLRKVDGQWLIEHDHISVPADLEHGRALMDLEP